MTHRGIVLAIIAISGCTASAGDGGGDTAEPRPDAGDPGGGPVPSPDATPEVELCMGLPASMGDLGDLTVSFGYYRDGVNDIYRFGGMGTANDLVDLMLVQNKAPFGDGVVDAGDYSFDTTAIFDNGIKVLIYPGTVFDGDIADLTGVNPTFAAVSAEVDLIAVSTTTAEAKVQDAVFVEVDYALEPVPGGCTTEIESFSVDVPTFTP
jgi:hypothetical protein